MFWPESKHEHFVHFVYLIWKTIAQGYQDSQHTQLHMYFVCVDLERWTKIITF